ncbi:MAG: metallophosphoesterase family protein [Acidimicrobiales bacterium]
MRLTWLSPSPLQVWAVEPGAAQLTWGNLPRGQMSVETPGRAPIRFVHEGGPGALVVENIPPGPAIIDVRSVEGVTRLHTTIPAAPHGEELCRIATVSDLHLGSGNWGALRTIRDIEPDADDHYDMRCATAAVQDAIDWGASLLVIKGDAVHHRRTRDFELVGEFVDRFPRLPMIMVPGNHDVDDAWPIELPSSLGKRGLQFEMGVRSHDMPGVRVIAGNTTIEHDDIGSVEPIRDDLLDAAGSATTPNLMLLHHQFQKYPVATYWPPGIPSKESKPFLSDLAKTAPRTLVSSGHTHRNRARRVGPLLVTEVGSTKDWPGSWAGYRIFEGGVHQTVRRVADPSAIRWTEFSRRAVGGLWSAWSPGALSDRCAAL